MWLGVCVRAFNFGKIQRGKWKILNEGGLSVRVCAPMFLCDSGCVNSVAHCDEKNGKTKKSQMVPWKLYLFCRPRRSCGGQEEPPTNLLCSLLRHGVRPPHFCRPVDLQRGLFVCGIGRRWKLWLLTIWDGAKPIFIVVRCILLHTHEWGRAPHHRPTVRWAEEYVWPLG